MCTVFLDRAGSCEGTQLERGMCRLACFHWNVACIVSQTINRCLLAFLLLLFTSFLFETPQVQTEVMLMDSCPKWSSRSLWWPQRRDGSAASGMHEWAFSRRCFCEGAAVCESVLLWWIIKKKTQWMLSCSEDETLIWWKETAPQWNHVWQLEDNLLK